MRSGPSAELTAEELAAFDWISLRTEMDAVASTETVLQKLCRKSAENPMVPIGAAATTLALGYGIWSFRNGRSKMSQYMMRTRVAAQGFTVLAIVLGYVYGLDKK
ncbi:HIG1 domain family member 2A, mitochondrial [Dendroctonus ponderosae]